MIPSAVKTDKAYGSKAELRGHFTMKGGHTTTLSRPSIQRLRTFEQITYKDSVLNTGLDLLVKSIISTSGTPSHPDPEIAEFLTYNIEALQDDLGIDWTDILYNMIRTTLWAGYSVSETLYNLEFGKLSLAGLETYHPSTIILRTDKNGRLTDGKPTYSPPHKSGVYQSINRLKPEVKIPLWKVVYLGNNVAFGNYYGQSAIAPCYKWHLLKEALIDMMAIALDRYGNPLLYVKMPVFPTNRTTVDPSTGEERAMTTQEVFQESIQGLDSNENLIFLPQQDGSNKPEIGTLTTGNNIGSTFLDAIQNTVEQELLPLIPPLLLTNELHGNNSNIERRMEVFYNTLDHYRRRFINSIARQLFSHLIKFNFNRTSAKYPGYFNKVYSDRPEDRVAIMQTVRGMTETGYFNPLNSEDYKMVRQMVRGIDRDPDKKDVEFIKKILELNQEKGGRPQGVSKPQDEARARTPQKPNSTVANRRDQDARARSN